MGIIVTVLRAQRINVHGRVDISLLQLAKRQSTTAGAENHSDCQYVACQLVLNKCD